MKLRDNLHIRKMQESDIETVLSIEEENYTLPWKNSHFLSAVTSEKFFCYVMTFGVEIISYAVVSNVLDEWELQNITVSKKHQKNGIATSLLSFIINLIKENKGKFFYLEVRETNSKAIKLYENFNFKEYGSRKNYYGPENAILMELKI